VDYVFKNIEIEDKKIKMQIVSFISINRQVGHSGTREIQSDNN
jgi:hypothetical protein